jgi:5-methylcytosine-specific restriction endonuclease McrA
VNDYDQYMSSEAWQKRKKDIINKFKGRCQLCNSDKMVKVHHRTYRRFRFEEPEDLTVLCERCHELFHNRYIYNKSFHEFMVANDRERKMVRSTHRNRRKGRR